jgi:hypothetical protein
VLLVVLFIAKGGKPYYVAGMFPVLLAAGAGPTVDWMRRGRRTWRRVAVTAAFVLSAPTILIALPVVPLSSLHTTSIVSVNYDIGETVAWPTYVAQIADVYRQVPGGAIVTSNYGEAGAVDRYGTRVGLPHAYSGHNGYYYWGPPPDTTTTVVAVGFGQAFLQRVFGDVRLAAHLHNPYDVDNDEQDEPVWICSQPRASWRALWPKFREIG